MRIVWTEAAAGDVDAIWECLKERSPNAAGQVEDIILKAVTKLADQPYMGRPGHREGTRELIVSRYPYLVVYGVESQEVVIYHIYHGSQDWPAALNDEE